MAMEKAPHRVADEVLDKLGEVPEGISESLSSGLDKLPLGDRGPHRMVDTVVKKIGEGTRAVGESIASTLDKPIETMGR